MSDHGSTAAATHGVDPGRGALSALGRPMRLLVIGSGGREHALVWKLLQSPRVAEVLVAPGNAGTEGALGPGGGRARNLEVGSSDVAGIVAAARGHEVDLVLIGPEAPLGAGLVDALAAAGVHAFGPRRVAAQLECSKAFAKQFMRRHGIPTAEAAVFDDADDALAWLGTHPGPRVVKASGLAAGKGVFVCDDAAAAAAAVEVVMRQRLFGDSGATVLLEERLEGEEVSILAFCDGRTALPMPAAQDHKRAWDGDLGPNTGGMGAYAPAPCVDAALMRRIHHEVLLPVMAGMRAEAYPYVGVLFAGIMLTAAGPKVLEFNCRFGDPETEALLPLLDGDLLDIVLACIEGRLDSHLVHWRQGSAAAVVLAAPGYPGSYPKGARIGGLDAAAALPGVEVFHAGTALRDGAVVSAGGRVLAVTGRGGDLREALAAAYRGCDAIEFEGKQLRRDIGHRALVTRLGAATPTVTPNRSGGDDAGR